jgi:hypothetical protein
MAGKTETPGRALRRGALAAAFVAGSLVTAALMRGDVLQWLRVSPAAADAGLYAPRDWTLRRPGKLNISVYAFSDRNRNGVYDLGDKPEARIAVAMTRPGGGTRMERSNINGYTNFSMQLEGSKADINTVGESYDFALLAPPGWEVTTDNARQSSRFRAVAGSVSGMGAETPPTPVGLAPVTRVAASWPARSGQSVIAARAGEQPRRLRIGADGALDAELPPGRWILSAADRSWQSAVDLEYAPVVLGSPTGPERAGEAMGRTVLVDFEDNQRSAIEKIPGGYAGLDWDYLLAVDNQFYKGPGYVNGLMSGSRVAYNSSGHPVTISARKDGGGRFDFVGGYFSVAWHNAEGETLIARAWRGDTLLAEDRITLSHLGPVYFQADYRDVSRVELETEHYWQFVVDDLSFRVR